MVKPGQYRDGRVKIGKTNYIPQKNEIENLMFNFLKDFVNLKEDIYLRTIVIHFVIFLIQLFYYSNKRIIAY